MLLQIDKVLKKEIGTNGEAHLRSDIIEGVKRTCYSEGFVQVHFRDGTCDSYTIGGKEKIDNVAEEWNDYKTTGLWLLNDEGKTLRKLL